MLPLESDSRVREAVSIMTGLSENAHDDSVKSCKLNGYFYTIFSAFAEYS